jgi:HK97 family phage portal protein
MSIISRLQSSWRELWTPIKAAEVMKPSEWMRAEAESYRYNMPDGSTYEAQADLYRVLSWVNIAISNMAAIASITKLNVKKMTGERDVDIPNHDFERLLMRPNPLYSRFELFNATFCYYGLNNNAYWFLLRKNETAPPTEIWPVNPAHIQPVPDSNSYIAGYVYTPPGGGKPYPLETWEISHYKGFNPNNPFVGLSKMESIVTDARSDLNQQEWNLKVFGANNGRLPGILAFGDTYDKPQWEQMKKDINSSAQMRAYMMLQGVGSGGVNLVNTSTSPKDMEFLSGRRFTMEEIFNVIAPGLSSILSVNATEANSKTGKATLIDLVIWPLLVMMAEKITNDILPAYGPDLKAEFDDIRITDRALILSETAEYAKYHTPNEVRSKYYNSDPIEGGDTPAFGSSSQPAPQMPAIPQPVLQPDTESKNMKGGEGSGRYPKGSGGGEKLDSTFHYNRTKERKEGRVAFGFTPKNEVAQSTFDPSTDSQAAHGTLARRSGLTEEGDFKVRGYLTHFEDADGDSHPVAIVYGQSNWGKDAEQRVNYFTRNMDKLIKETGFEKPERVYVSFNGGYSGIDLAGWNPEDPSTYLVRKSASESQDLMEFELEKWQRKAAKRLKEKGSAACEFESDHIQTSIHGAIDGGLSAAKTVDDVRRIFANAQEWRGYP